MKTRMEHGYPDRLKDNEIALEAEIIKVADVYDALTNTRQYREGLNKEIAIKIMKEEEKKGCINKKIFKALLECIEED